MPFFTDSVKTAKNVDKPRQCMLWQNTLKLFASVVDKLTVGILCWVGWNIIKNIYQWTIFTKKMFIENYVDMFNDKCGNS